MTIATIKESVRPWLQTASASPVLREPLLRMARMGALPDAVWKRLPVERTFRVDSVDGASFVYRSTPEDVIGRRLYWKGGESWEPETIGVFARLARRAQWVLDVGANTGLFSLIACAANPNVSVMAFEPVPSTHQRLSENIALNGWSGRVQLHAEAVADRTGLAKLHIPAEGLPSSASLHAAGFRGQEGRLVEVAVTTIDHACPAGAHVDLAKIDVEGFEDKVLLGMTRVLHDSRPMLVIECNPDGPFGEVEAILRSFGYHFYHLREDGPVPVERIEPDPRERSRNFLCSARGIGEVFSS